MKVLITLPLLLAMTLLGAPGDKKYKTVEPKVDYQAFATGENLGFTLHFGAINAGKATLKVNKDLYKIKGKDHYHIEVDGWSLSTFNSIYKVDDHYESFLDVDSKLPTLYIRDVVEGSYEKKENYVFNHKTNKMKSGDKILSVKPGMHDIVSAFYYLRCIDFANQAAGSFYPINTMFEEEEMPLGMNYEGTGKVSTSLGEFKVYIFTPLLATGRVFKEQSDMKIYVSQDKNQIPIRIESKVYLGYVRADLTSYSGLKYPLTAKVK